MNSTDLFLFNICIQNKILLSLMNEKYDLLTFTYSIVLILILILNKRGKKQYSAVLNKHFLLLLEVLIILIGISFLICAIIIRIKRKKFKSHGINHI